MDDLLARTFCQPENEMRVKTVAKHLIFIFTDPLIVYFLQDGLYQFTRFKRFKRDKSGCHTVINIVTDVGYFIRTIYDHGFDAGMCIQNKSIPASKP